jgi:hypothetical protein
MKNDMQEKTNPNGALPLQQKYCFFKYFQAKATFSDLLGKSNRGEGPKSGSNPSHSVIQITTNCVTGCT